MTEITHIAVNQIHAGHNDRTVFDPVALAALAANIAEHNLIQPLTVRMMAPDPNCVFGGDPAGPLAQYEIVAGERRYRAISQHLPLWGTIPCIVAELSNEQAAAVMLAENVARQDINPVDEANAYASRMKLYGWTIPQCSSGAGVSEARVERRLSLLALHPDVQHLVANGHLPLGHAEALARLDHYRQLIALRVYREAKAMPLATFRTVVGDLYGEQEQEGLFDLEQFWMEKATAMAATPTRGKCAVVDVPTRPDLPHPEMKITDTTSSVIMRYIRLLDAQGLRQEAATIGTIYSALIHSNSMALPTAV